MISAIELGNFKAFAHTQQIPIRPLTLIFGPNSAGKSSLIHSLLLAHHAIRTGELDCYRTSIGGESVDLGGFRQYIYQRDASRQLEWGVTVKTADLTGDLAQLLAAVNQLSVAVTVGVARDDHGQPLSDVAPFVTSYEMSADGEPLLRMSRRRDGTLRLDRLVHEHRLFGQMIKAVAQATSELGTEADAQSLDEAIYDLVPHLSALIDRFLPHTLTIAESPSLPKGQATSVVPASQGSQFKDLAAAVRYFLPRTLNSLIGGVTDIITTQLNKLRYLGPLRSYPPRHLTFSPQYDKRLQKFPKLLKSGQLSAQTSQERLQKFPKLLKSGQLSAQTGQERLQKFPKLLKSGLSGLCSMSNLFNSHS